jgi:hypothetical protein
MKPKYERVTVDLQDYPDLIVIYLGMQPVSPRGVGTLLRTGYDVWKMLQTKPEGMLRHETVFTLNGFFSLSWSFGFRQYWRSFDDLERWARNSVHAEWWRKMAQDTSGTMIWHETYAMQGGIDAIWGGTSRVENLGLAQFAPVQPVVGSSYSARRRMQREQHGETTPAPLAEEQIYPE